MKNYWAEFLGTFALVFCGTGAIVVNEVTAGIVTHVGIALTFGLIVAAMIYTFGEISGAHFNPAVSIGFWACGRFPVQELAPYISSQVAGALAASGFLRLLFPGSATLGATLPVGTAFQSLVLETILSFLLTLVIMRVSHGTNETRKFAGIAVGSVVLLEAAFAGPISGASMNPARSLAPALVSGRLEFLWVYLLAPVAGALLAVLAVQPFLKTKMNPDLRSCLRQSHCTRKV